jgi:hypothetical protein
MKYKITPLVILFFPNRVAVFLLNLLGHNIHKTAYIGFSWISSHDIQMDAGSRIGHLNLIRIPVIRMGENASIRMFNRMKGSLTLMMDKRAAIGNSNSIYRGPYPITIGSSVLSLGTLAIITSKHHFDCTCSIFIGDYTTVSGFNTEFWTHGFYHAAQGSDRIRVDGSIHIENNVSIGSRCMIMPGIKVGAAINIGSNSCVSKSIFEPGMYVSQSLRYISNDIETIKSKLQKNTGYKIVDVYEKPVA